MDWGYLFDLDRSTGKIYWRIKPAPCIRVGAEAGTLRKDGYLQVRYKDVSYYVHRIVFEMLGGTVPYGYTVDHINGNKSDNCPDNLRLASVAENAWNQKKASNNTSGMKGLNIHKHKHKWYWRAQVDYKTESYIKRFPYTEEGKLEAIAWLQATREGLHLDFANHG